MANCKVIPAIDLMDGRVVRLRQGNFSDVTVYGDDPVSLAKAFYDRGLDRVHVVDLDGARQGIPRHLKAIERITQQNVTVELGGGIRSRQTIRDVFDAGVAYAVIGSVALTDPDEFESWVDTYPDRLVGGLDVREGRPAIAGWEQEVRAKIDDVLANWNTLPLAGVIVTDIVTDGMATGPNVALLRDVCRRTTHPVTASGGIGSAADIRRVQQLAIDNLVGVIVGKAFYDGQISLDELATC